MAPSPRPRKDTLVHAKTASEWRAWLRANHKKAPEGWLVMARKGSGRPFVDYNDAVDAALCYGWIDSVVMPLSDGLRAQRYTPRRAGSPVSETNKARVRRLVKARRMTKAGLAALPGVDEWLDPPPLVVAGDILAQIRADAAAWRVYRTLPEPYLRIRIGWIEDARDRPAVFEKRLAHFIKKTAEGKRFGMIQE